MSSSLVHPAVASLVLALAAHAAAAPPDCDAAPPKRLVERFVPADCETCWQTASARDRSAGTMVLDWIVPAGDAAPLAAAALRDAADRVKAAKPRETTYRPAAIGGRAAPELRVSDGPAWNGYIAMQLTVRKRGALPKDAVGYLALVERVPAGSEGTPVERQLVRALAGPLLLQELATEAAVQHFAAVGVPDTERPERLASVGWIETAGGRVIAATQSPRAECLAESR